MFRRDLPWLGCFGKAGASPYQRPLRKGRLDGVSPHRRFGAWNGGFRTGGEGSVVGFRSCCGQAVRAPIAEDGRAGGVGIYHGIGREEGFAEFVEVGGGAAGADFPEETGGVV